MEAEDEEECSQRMDLDLDDEQAQHPAERNAAGAVSPLERFSVQICQLLASGLADPTENWAQVR